MFDMRGWEAFTLVPHNFVTGRSVEGVSWFRVLTARKLRRQFGRMLTSPSREFASRVVVNVTALKARILTLGPVGAKISVTRSIELDDRVLSLLDNELRCLRPFGF